MKLTFERLGYLYRIKFTYSADKKRHRIVTCQLEVKTNGHRFVKEEGRKLALARAIANMNREDRARAWAAYWGRTTEASVPVMVGGQIGVVLQ
jgi:hypothetical protein